VFDLQAEIQEFREKEYREAYADEFLNTYVATQIRVLREQREMTQHELAEVIGTHQAGISRIENVNYSGWGIRTLKKVARALGCRLHISFETYGSLLEEGAAFARETLRRPSFEDDPEFRIARNIRRTAKVLDFYSLGHGQPRNTGISRGTTRQARRTNPAQLSLPIYEQPEIREAG
jgi:transcriptional regulator with XRE-family HTH domain